MGLVALWWESLLAKSVLEGKTTDYINHPQLICFRNYVKPLQAINTYLMYINEEAKKRGFAFDPRKYYANFVNQITTGSLLRTVRHCKPSKKCMPLAGFISIKLHIKLHVATCKVRHEQNKYKNCFYN
ncbi:MAG: pyrimidine dimer DNA glycosylase/endonuclease V [Candidatus Micrarchaeia archaeon]